MKIYWQLFWIFFKIGAFTLGGGYAMLPLLEREIVHNKKWIDGKDFIDRIGLHEHLSPTRSNGLLAMVKQMRLYALAFKAASAKE